ncbi:MAG: T9SS type A sorting domain-containing protein [Chitinophagaceae bacterium]|nr:T9SS type A sorting domain-containing protein [Chitinophagaceae bacterium]
MKTFVYSLIFLLIGLRAEAGNKLMWQRFLNDTTRNQNSIYWYHLDKTLDQFGNIYVSEIAHSGDSSVPIIYKVSASGEIQWRKNLLPLNASGQYYCINRDGKIFEDADGNIVHLYALINNNAGANARASLLMSKINQFGQIVNSTLYGLPDYPNSLIELKDVSVQPNGDFFVAISNEARDTDSSILTTLKFNKDFDSLYHYKYYDAAPGNGYSGGFKITVKDSLLFCIFGDSGTVFHTLCVNMLQDSLLWHSQFTPVDASNYDFRTEFMGGYLYIIGLQIFKLSIVDGSLLAQSTPDFEPYRYVFDSSRNIIYTVNFFSKNLTIYDLDDLHFIRNRKLASLLHDIKMVNSELYISAYSWPEPNNPDYRHFKIYKLDSLLNDIDSLKYLQPAIVQYAWWDDFLLDSNLNIFEVFGTESYRYNTFVSTSLVVEKMCFNCYGDLRGRVYLDVNQNCLFDTSDHVVTGNAVTLLPDSITTYTDSNGFYDFFSSPGSTQIECQPFLNGMPFCGTGSPLSINPIMGPTDSLDFGYYGGKLINKDVDAKLMASTARPGFNQYLLGIYTNHSTEPLYGTVVTISLDTPFSYVNSFPAMDSVIGQTIFFTIDTFLINATREIGLQVVSNATLMSLGDTFHHVTEVLLTGDMAPNNNLDTASGIVVGSYDPNYIAVTPVGLTKEHLIENGTTLDYYVEFQNTGTDTAFNVKIKVPIDNDLDISTFRLTSSSHTCRAQIENQSINFIFEGILLVDSSKDYEKSIGHLTYSLKPKNCKDGTYLTAHAAIYFDYNEPVITNTVFNRIGRPGSIFIPDNVDDFNLFPNPSVTNSFKLVVNAISPNYEIVVLDLVGRKIPIQDEQYSYNDKDYHSISVLDAAEGFYFVQMRTPRHVISKKWLYLGD